MARAKCTPRKTARVTVESDNETKPEIVSVEKPTASATQQKRKSFADKSEVDGCATKKLKRMPTFHELRRSMITVKVGPEAYPFVLYKELLCHHSGFFHRAVDDAEKRKVNPSTITELDADELRAVDVEVFKAFQLWLEQQEVKVPVEPGDGELSIRRIVDVYNFAERFDVRKLCNAAVDRINTYTIHTKVKLPGEVIADIWDQLRPNSVLRSYLVQQYALHRCLDDVDKIESTSSLSQDFLFQVVVLTSDVLWQHCFLNNSAFTLDEADLDDVRALPRKFLAKFMLINMHTLRTFCKTMIDHPLEKWKNGMKACDYHEHADPDEKAKCPGKHTHMRF